MPTITGGEAFAGGPWNNFVLQTTAAMVERLRGHRDVQGLVSTLSGLVNKPGLAVYSTRARCRCRSCSATWPSRPSAPRRASS